MGVLYLDTETTGLKPGQICELSMIHEADKEIVGVYNYFFSVDSMDQGAQSVHGYSISDLNLLSNGKRFKDYAKEIESLIVENTIVAHNLPFDEKFLSVEFMRLGNYTVKPVSRLDTMKYFKDIVRLPAKLTRYGPYKNPKLSELVSFFNISEQKINITCDKLFNTSDSHYLKTSYHDSRFDTTAIYIITNLYREMLYGGDTWKSVYCSND